MEPNISIVKSRVKNAPVYNTEALKKKQNFVSIPRMIK